VASLELKAFYKTRISRNNERIVKPVFVLVCGFMKHGYFCLVYIRSIRCRTLHIMMII